MAFKRVHQLPSQAWVNGGNLQIPTKDIPALARIKAFVFTFEAVFTCGGAAAAIVSGQLHRLINMIDCGPGKRASGMYWHVLEQHMRGGETTAPFGIPATNAGVFRRWITWTVPFYDPRAAFPSDDCPTGADYADKVIQLETASFASLGAGTWDTLASVTGTLRCRALLDEPNDAGASIVEFGFYDLTGQAPTLDPALYVDAFVYREAGTTISNAQIATAAIQVDGVQVFDITRLSEYARMYNDLYARGGDQHADSATAPVTGEAIPETPTSGNGDAETTILNPFVPLIVPPPRYKKTQGIVARSQMRIDFTGTDSTFRVGYRRIRRRSDDEAIGQFQRMGLPVTGLSQISAKTGSKKPLSLDKNGLWRYLPTRALVARQG